MPNSEQENSKAKFKAALEKKNRVSRDLVAGTESDGGRGIKESSGKTPKMFRRKSG